MKKKLGEGSLRSRLDRLWGRDVFISYSRADGAAYALGLAAQLAKRNYACVIDQWGMSTPGTVTPAQLRRLLRGCRALVLVATRASGSSEHVAKEIQEFTSTPGMIIPVDLDGSIRAAAWWPLVDGLPIAVESGGAEASAPDEAVMDRIANALTFRRRDQRLRRTALATASVLALMLGGIGVLFIQSANLGRENAQAMQDLDARGRDLVAATSRASKARRDLEATSRELRQQRIELGIAQANTRTARLAATTAQREARLAQAQATIAQTRALLARNEARRQLAIADAVQIAVTSTEDTRPPMAALLAAQSLERHWTVPGTRAAITALNRWPGLIRRFEVHGHYGLIALSPRERFLAAGDYTTTDDNHSSEVQNAGWAGIRLWNIASGSEIARQRRSLAPSVIRFSPDERYLADGTCDGTITIMSTDSAAIVRTIRHERNCPRVIRFSDDGRLIAVGGNLTTGIYELPSGTRVNTWSHAIPQRLDSNEQGIAASSRPEDGAPAVEVLFAPSSTQFFAASGNEISVRDVRTGSSRSIPLPARIDAMALSPDGNVIAVALHPANLRTASGDTHGADDLRLVQVIDAAGGRVIRQLDSPAVTSLAFSPEGDRLITGSEDNIRIWDWRNSREMMAIPARAPQIAISRDGNRLFGGGSYGARVFDSRTGAELATTDGSYEYANSAFSTEGNYIATYQRVEDNQRNRREDSEEISTVRVRASVAIGEMVRMESNNYRIAGPVYSPAARYLAAARRNELYAWDLITGEEKTFVLAGDFSPEIIEFTNDTTIMAYIPYSRQAYRIDLSTTTAERVTTPIYENAEMDYSDILALLSNREVTQRINELINQGDDGDFLTLKINSQRTRLALITMAGLEVFDIPSGRRRFVRRVGTGATESVFDPSGRWLAANIGNSIAIFDANTGSLVSEIALRGSVGKMAFSPTARTIAATDTGPGGNRLSVWFWQPYDLISELCRRIDDSVFLESGILSPDASPDTAVCLRTRRHAAPGSRSEAD